KRIEDARDRLHVIVEVARARAKRERAEAAKLLREALAEARHLKDPPQILHARAEALLHIASVQAEMVSGVEARAWANGVEPVYDRVAALRGVAEGVARRNAPTGPDGRGSRK